MKTIFKYEMDTADMVHLYLPEGAEILTVQAQNDGIFLWALVDDSKPKTIRHFEVIGTGHPVYVDMGVERKYIATVQVEGFVWHVFERL